MIFLSLKRRLIGELDERRSVFVIAGAKSPPWKQGFFMIAGSEPADKGVCLDLRCESGKIKCVVIKCRMQSQKDFNSTRRVNFGCGVLGKIEHRGGAFLPRGSYLIRDVERKFR